MGADGERARTASLVVLALLGLAISTYLAAFQLGVIAAPWDPFFGDGSRAVLTSDLSRALPVPDAAMGAGLYLVDAVLGTWLALRPGVLPKVGMTLAAIATAGAAVGVFLVAYQVLAVQALCTLCLGSALISWLLAAGAIAEARARRRASASSQPADSPAAGTRSPQASAHQ